MARLRESLTRATQGESLQAFLAPDVLRAAEELEATIAPSGDPREALADLDAAELVVTARWMRYEALSVEDDEAERQICERWAKALMTVAPDLVPGQIREYLTGLWARPPEGSSAVPSAPYVIRPGVWLERAMTMLRGYDQTRQPELLDSAVDVFRILAEELHDHPERGVPLAYLTTALVQRFRATRRLDDVDAAVEAGRAALRALDAGHPLVADVSFDLAMMLHTRFALAGDGADLADLADLDEAVGAARTAVTGTSPGDRGYGVRHFLLGRALYDRARKVADRDDVADVDSNDQTESLDHLRAATSPADPGTPVHPGWRIALAEAYAVGLVRNPGPDYRDAAIDALLVAEPLLERSDPLRVPLLAALGMQLQQRDRPGDLEEAAERLGDGPAAFPEGTPGRGQLAVTTAKVLSALSHRTGQPEHLARAVAAGETAGEDAGPDGRPTVAALTAEGSALRLRYEREGRPEDLDRAIELLAEAVARTDEDADRALPLALLAVARRMRYARTGDLRDLDDAVDEARAAARMTYVRDSSRPEVLGSLSTVLMARAAQTGELTDLDDAVAAARDAMDATPERTHGHVLAANNLSVALHARYRRADHVEDLDAAIATGRLALDEQPGNPDRPRNASNLAVVLQLRYQLRKQPEDLAECVTLLTEAVTTTGADDPERPHRLVNLGAMLVLRYNVGEGDVDDLKDALQLLDQASRLLAEDHPDQTSVLAAIGFARVHRFHAYDLKTDDYELALAAWREAARIPTAAPDRRLAAAEEWTRFALLRGDMTDALASMETSIDILPLLAWHGLDRSTREYQLRQWSGLAVQAVAVAVAAGEPERAVELMERSRTTLWRQALRLRENFDAVRAVDPRLADALENARAVLNAPLPEPGAAGDLSDTGQTGKQQRADEQHAARRRAARDWDDALRQLPGSAGVPHVLGTVPFAGLRAAAVDGPVVIVNVSAAGSHALIVHSPSVAVAGVTVVPLPEASHETVVEQVNRLREAQQRAGERLSFEEREADRHAVFDILDWTWRAIAEPVLLALGHLGASEAAADGLPASRVWWCPLGMATLLPLHAAGLHPRTSTQATALGEAAAVRDTVAGRVVSSYTTTLTGLAQSRSRGPAGTVRHLFIGVPDARDVPPLPGVHGESRVLAGLWPDPERATQLVGPDARVTAVLDALPGYSWLHLSSHGLQHPEDASRSAFILDDGPLTLAEIAELHLDDADLAYLAACQTATGDVRLPDEALHLAAALQVVGFRHVLGTLWSVSDAAAPLLAAVTYAHLLHADPAAPRPDEVPDASRAAHALHAAVAQLRRAAPADPLVWAPYIHLGP